MPTTSIETHTAASLQKKLAEILETWPLYRQFCYEGVSLHTRSQSGKTFLGCFPKSIRLYCDHDDCKNSQIWELTDYPEVTLSLEFIKRTYVCRNCKKCVVIYFVSWSTTDDGITGLFYKVGQWPPLSHRLPKELERRLDREDHAFYVKALDCRNFNYGLGAVAYMRRVVENRTNDLLDLIAAALKAEGIIGERLTEIEETKKSRVYDKKLELAQKLLPKRLIKGGENPIKKVHEVTSEAIHGKAEQECIDIFDSSRVAFEYVFSELEDDRARAEEYAKAIKALKEKANPKPEPTEADKKAE
jgi:hypothetical protein